MNPSPGQFYVVRTSGPVAWLIRRVTRSAFNHAGLVAGNHGAIIEAEAGGVYRAYLAKYAGERLAVSQMPLSQPEREWIVCKANECIGRRYNWLDLLALGLLQFGVRPRFLRRVVEYQNRLVCSELVALCYLAAGIRLSRDPEMDLDVTPGTLAKLIEKETRCSH